MCERLSHSRFLRARPKFWCSIRPSWISERGQGRSEALRLVRLVFRGLTRRGSKILVVYHRILAVPDTRRDANILRDAVDARAFLREKVDMVISGHHHIPCVWSIFGFRIASKLAQPRAYGCGGGCPRPITSSSSWDGGGCDLACANSGKGEGKPPAPSRKRPSPAGSFPNSTAP